MTQRDFKNGNPPPLQGTNLGAPLKRVLVVDDDTAVRTALMEVLAGEGYFAVPAGGGLQAVALAAEAPVDLVLLDINLMGQSGWDTFTEFAATHPTTPMIIITAKPGQYSQAVRLQADALMEKPLNLPLLLETIDKFLAEPKAQRRQRRSAASFQTCYLNERVRSLPEGDGSWNQAAPPDHTLPGEKTALTAKPGPERKRILVVDDDASVRQMLGRILTDEGYAVVEAAAGAQALESAAREQVHLVLLDPTMPLENGWDTFERLTAWNACVPVIVITARPNPRLTDVGAGVGALMEKPLDFPKLLQTIRVLLAEKPEAHLARMARRRTEFTSQPPGATAKPIERP